MSIPAAIVNTPYDFLSGGGEMGQRIREFDWCSSPLGPIDRWPQALRWTASLCLDSSFPSAIYWSDTHILMYNDAWIAVAADRHPQALGRAAKEVWPDLWDVFGPRLQTVLNEGGPVLVSDQVLPVAFAGHTIETHWNYSLAPIRDESGQVLGVLYQGHETTQRVVQERQNNEVATALSLAQSALTEETRALGILRTANATFASDLNLEHIVQSLTDAGTELVGAAFGSYFHNELDETGEYLKLYTLSGATRADFEKLGHPRATAIFAPTFLNEGVVRCGDILKDPRYGLSEPHRGMPPGHLPVRSYMAISVVSRSGDVMGGLFFGHPQPGRFTARHERFMVTLAANAAIAIDNARLFLEVQQANATLEQRVTQRTEELMQTHEALRQSQKMEALGQLTGGIAHDFNNLLAGILGSAELLERRLQKQTISGHDKLIAAIQLSAKRAAALTQRLLAFSRRQTLDPKPVIVSHLVEGMEELIRRAVGPAIAVQIIAQDTPALARLDAAQLESSLLNLAINARDAMPQGGRITIFTETIKLDAFAASRMDLPIGEYLALTVSDTGSGIAAAHLKLIFDPFFTTKPIGQGTGLGLSMVHGFVRQSGGQVEVISQEGEGTSFRLLLPRFEPAFQVSPAADAPAYASETRSGARILVVDDEPVVREFVAQILRDAGHVVLEAEDGIQALRLIETAQTIDLLVTDVGLPGGLNGRQVCDALRQDSPGLKVLFITGYAESTVLGEGFVTDITQVLTKPFSVAVLESKVARMLG